MGTIAETPKPVIDQTLADLEGKLAELLKSRLQVAAHVDKARGVYESLAAEKAHLDYLVVWVRGFIAQRKASEKQNAG